MNICNTNICNAHENERPHKLDAVKAVDVLAELQGLEVSGEGRSYRESRWDRKIKLSLIK